jgi:hypothetical protein
MEFIFSTRDDGQVDARLGPEWPLFSEALGDSISSLPPRGAAGNGPSTYWIDIAEHGARRAAQSGDVAPFTWGNSTLLRVQSGNVVAAYDCAEENEPGEAIPLDEFLALLAEWRKRVIASASTSSAPLPETYRRNPADNPPDIAQA